MIHIICWCDPVRCKQKRWYRDWSIQCYTAWVHVHVSITFIFNVLYRFCATSNVNLLTKAFAALFAFTVDS